MNDDAGSGLAADVVSFSRETGEAAGKSPQAQRERALVST
jgi:hypothetical protein